MIIFPETDKNVIIIPLIITPFIIQKADFFLFNPIAYETKDPVQAPVPGKGIATNNVSA